MNINKNIHRETGEEMRVVNSLNAKDRLKHGREISSISQTIPDQSIPIRTLLDRHSRGFEIEGQRVPLYNPTGMGINPKTLDNIDLAELAEQNIANIQHLKDKADADKKAAAEARIAAREKADEEAAERIARKMASKKNPTDS
ncbi:MAG: hypothetical protein [Microviridae sp.]|nr:MAG: hypothetical protein [Microviridae sp.]